jgi:hypothetical protein
MEKRRKAYSLWRRNVENDVSNVINGERLAKMKMSAEGISAVNNRNNVVKKMKEKKIFRFKAANEAYREEAGE